MKKLVLFVFSLSMIFTACDKVEDPFEGVTGQSFSFEDGVEYITEPSLGINDTAALRAFIDNNTWVSKTAPDNSSQRFITLEEFTGHTCTFCPDGTKEIVRLDGIYGDQLIPVSIHAGSFAQPVTTGNKYTTDFRVPEGRGETYRITFNVAGYPSGIVSRIRTNSSGKDTWAQDIAAIKDDSPKAILAMTNYYSSQANAIRSQIEITWNETLPEDYNLQLFLVEDNIVDWQLDNGVEIENYNHRHVLRKVINDTFGKTLEKGVDGESVSFQYIFSVNAAWKANDLKVVAFIFNRDSNSYEVIQANSASIN